MQDTEIFIRIYKRLITSGLYAALGKERVFALIALSMYMNKDGVCFPTQEQLAKDMGVTEVTANKYIRWLKEFTWNGKPIITVEKSLHGGGWANCTYKLHPELQIAIFDGEIAAIEQEIKPVAQTDTLMGVDICDITENDTGNVDEAVPIDIYSGMELPDYSVEDIDTENQGFGSKVITTEHLEKTHKAIDQFCKCYSSEYILPYSVNSEEKQIIATSELIRENEMDMIYAVINQIFYQFPMRWQGSYKRPSIIPALTQWWKEVLPEATKRVEQRRKWKQELEQERQQKKKTA